MLRKFTWFLLFLVTLLVLVYFLRSAIPRLPFTEPPAENTCPPPGNSDTALMLLICDSSAVRGSEFIVLSVPETGQPRALYIPGCTTVNGQALSLLSLQGPATVRRALATLIPIDHYVAVNLAAADSLTSYLAGADPPENAWIFLSGLIRSALRFETAGRLLAGLQLLAEELETDLSSLQIVSLATRLNRLNPEEIRIYTVPDPSSLPAIAAQFLEGR